MLPYFAESSLHACAPSYDILIPAWIYQRCKTYI